MDRHDQSYSWEVTMFWIGMTIHHNELCEHLWKSESMTPEFKASILLNAQDWIINYNINLFADFLNRLWAATSTEEVSKQWTLFWCDSLFGDKENKILREKLWKDSDEAITKVMNV